MTIDVLIAEKSIILHLAALGIIVAMFYVVKLEEGRREAMKGSRVYNSTRRSATKNQNWKAAIKQVHNHRVQMRKD